MSTLVRKNTIWPSTSFFDDFLTRDLFDRVESTFEGSIPQVNIVETDDDFSVEMAAPGMKKNDFQVELDNDMLTIQAEVTNEQNQNYNYTRREFSFRSFQRSFYLPNTVEAEKIEGKYQDGILRLIIPKKEEARKKPVKTIAIS